MNGISNAKFLYERPNCLNQEWLEKAQYALNTQNLKSWVRGLRVSDIPDIILSHMKPALLNAYINTATKQPEGQNNSLWQRSHLIFCTDEKGNIRNLSLSPDVSKHVEDHLRDYIVDLFDQENIWEDAVRWYWNNSVTWTLEAMSQEFGKGISNRAWSAIYSKTLCYADSHRFYSMFDIYAKNFVDLFMRDFHIQYQSRPADSLAAFEELLGLKKQGIGFQGILQPKVVKEKASYLTTFSMAIYHQLRKAVATQEFSLEKEFWPSADLHTPSGSSQGYALFKTDAQQASIPIQGLLQGMNDETVDVIDAVCHLWLMKSQSQSAKKILIHADDILDLRGLRKQKNGQGQRGGYKSEWRDRVANHMRLLDQLWIDPSSESSALSEEKAFLISKLEDSQEAGSQDEYTWEVRPGDILIRDMQEGKRQTALLSKKVLELDPYRQSYEKRAARYFSWLWRSRQSRAQYLKPIRVPTLLEAINLEYRRSRSAKIIERFEKMMDVLKDKQIIANWQYDRVYENAREWLDLKLVVEPPQAIMDQYAKIKSPVKSLKQPIEVEPLSNLGEKLKKERLRRRLSQIQAAEEIGIDQTTLSRIELGRRHPDSRTVQKLQRWMINIST